MIGSGFILCVSGHIELLVLKFLWWLGGGKDNKGWQHWASSAKRAATGET